MDSLLGKRVYVYWNLHKKCFSVRYKGKVIAHTNEIALKNVEFRVSQKGRERVLREKRKNVHAYVVGEVIENPNNVWYQMEVTYNPYKFTSFVYKNLQQFAPIMRDGDIAHLINRKIFVGSPTI